MGNHLHLVAAADNLTEVARDFKSYTAKRLIARLEQDQKTWVLNHPLVPKLQLGNEN